MTIGYLLDLLIINEVRKEKLADELDASVKNDLDKQNGFYLREIGRYLSEISDGKRPGKFAKHKNYDRNIEEPENNNLIDVLYKLYQRHSTLWDLEDKRRDKRELDNIRLSYCDEVSVVNKKRNDLVEQIDKVININLKKIKMWGSIVE